jgi:hypothetical protein
MLRLIATFVLIYLVFRIVTAWLMPLVVRWYVNRYRKKYHENNPRVRKEDPPSKTDRLGEYVDYEEVKEDDQKPNTQ